MLQLRTASDFPGLFGDSAATTWLSQKEQEHLSGLKVAKRRREWLLGRATVKSAVQCLLASDNLAKHEIEVLPDDDKAPTITLLKDGANQDLLVSLSHRGGYALAAVEIAIKGRAIGVDIDRVEARPRSFLRDYFSEPEQAAIACAEPLEQDRQLTAFWCVKEALLKALKKGLSVSADRVEVLALGPDDKVSARFDNKLGKGELMARCWHLPGYVLTWVAIDTSVDGDKAPYPPFPSAIWTPRTRGQDAVILKMVGGN
jgi:4'-phosphopantetheinyl transferase